MNATRLCLTATPAVPPEEDLSDIADAGAFRAGGGRDVHFHVGQAGDFAAIDAHEVRVLVVVVVTGAAELEPPDMIPQLRAGEQAGLGHVDEIAIGGRPIEAHRLQDVGQVGMGQRGLRLAEVLEYRDAGGGTAESGVAQNLAKIIHTGDGPRLWLPHTFYHTIRPGVRPSAAPGWRVRTVLDLPGEYATLARSASEGELTFHFRE